MLQPSVRAIDVLSVSNRSKAAFQDVQFNQLFSRRSLRKSQVTPHSVWIAREKDVADPENRVGCEHAKKSTDVREGLEVDVFNELGRQRRQLR